MPRTERASFPARATRVALPIGASVVLLAWGAMTLTDQRQNYRPDAPASQAPNRATVAHPERPATTSDLSAEAAELSQLPLDPSVLEARPVEVPTPTEPRAKLSSDLLSLIDKGEPGPFRVLVQASPEDGDKKSVLEKVRSWSSRRTQTEGRCFDFIGAALVELDRDGLLTLAERGEISRISLDAPIHGALNLVNASTGIDQVRPSLLSSGFDGKGVTVAVLDSGCDRGHEDFEFALGLSPLELSALHSNADFLEHEIQDKMAADSSLVYHNVKDDNRLLSVDYVDDSNRDDYGHGTHVAGIIAGNGFETAEHGDLDPFVGGAPRVTLLNVRVLDDLGKGYTSTVIEALDMLIKVKDLINLRVVNLSFGHPVFESFNTDPLTLACAAAADAGLAVVCAAGNNGSDTNGIVHGGINSPGNAPWVITVGATNSNGTALRSDDTIANFSSRGPTLIDGGIKPDLVAPGSDVVSCSDDGMYLPDTYPELFVPKHNDDDDYIKLSGTSMAAPQVSACLALMFQANPSLSPGMAKFILLYTAEKMDNESVFAQGAGFLNAEGAVRMADTLRKDLDTLAAGDDMLPAGASLSSASTIEGELILFGSGILYRGGTVGSTGILYRPDDSWGNGEVWGNNLIYRSGENVVDPLAIVYRPNLPAGMMGTDTAGVASTSEGIVESNNLIFRPDQQPLWSTSLVDPTSLNATSDEVLSSGILYIPPGMTMAAEGSVYFPQQD